MKSRPFLRLAPWVVMLLIAYAVGRWQRLPPRPSAERATAAPPQTASIDVLADHTVDARIDQLLAAAGKMLRPDTATAAYFEHLNGADAALASEHLAALPSTTERDLLFTMAIRHWAELDPLAALACTKQLRNLPQRAAARAAVYEVWGMHDAQSAFVHALAEKEEGDRWRALPALLTGAAVAYPGGAVTLWEGTPPAFRESRAGREALQGIVDAADGTGQREALKTIVLGLPPNRERATISLALARDWGAHDLEGAVAWVRTVTSAGLLQDSMIDEVFAAYVHQDPIHAAAWAVRQSEERRRTNYVATAVAEWATYDSAAAETWVNEQPDGSYLDGATYAMATHFIERRRLQEAFAWTRRIQRNEARADLLGNLGRIWHEEHPKEFDEFLTEKSLNRSEIEMLKSKISAPPAS